MSIYSVGFIVNGKRPTDPAYNSPVTYDESLAERIGELVAGEPDVTERRMFGGLAFLVGGHMAIAASGHGGALVRVDPAESDALVARTKAERAVMSGREMDGWLRVRAEDLKTRRQLATWVERATAYARTLPAKSTKRKVRSQGAGA
jgi:TfoX/Sxy family transcriptional regulator of competence genes